MKICYKDFSTTDHIWSIMWYLEVKWFNKCLCYALFKTCFSNYCSETWKNTIDSRFQKCQRYTVRLHVYLSAMKKEITLCACNANCFGQNFHGVLEWVGGGVKRSLLLYPFCFSLLLFMMHLNGAPFPPLRAGQNRVEGTVEPWSFYAHCHCHCLSQQYRGTRRQQQAIPDPLRTSLPPLRKQPHACPSTNTPTTDFCTAMELVPSRFPLWFCLSNLHILMTSFIKFRCQKARQKRSKICVWVGQTVLCCGVWRQHWHDRWCPHTLWAMLPTLPWGGGVGVDVLRCWDKSEQRALLKRK